MIGAAFVPIDNDQPEIRADKILEIAKIKCLIGEKEETHKYREKYKWIDKDSVILKKSYDEIVNDNFDDVAYVIFTSGSTGEPKGVVIEQQAVVNTIIDINERFQVKDKDSILALSQLHFDLSVYDIFGMLATGGTIVIPEKVRYKDPSYWLMLVEKWNITVWNSVPAFMEMFVDYLERFYKGEKLSINKILLSGDWIPVKLPEKICRFLKDVRIYSLGGATEASIWSIYHECKMGESYNSSIPYGVPLAVKLLEKGIEVNNLFVIDSYPVSGKVEDQFIDEVIFLPNYQLMLSEVLEDVDDFKVMEFITEVRKRNNGNIPQNTFFNIIEKDTKMKNNSGLWEFVNSTKEKRFEAYAKAIEKKTCINVSAELLEATFEIYQHGFKGANVELPFYSGDICYLSACEEQKYFFADKNQNLEMWNDICLGEFEVINVPGNHVTCIHSEENATLLAQIIIERNIRG